MTTKMRYFYNYYNSFNKTNQYVFFCEPLDLVLFQIVLDTDHMGIYFSLLMEDGIEHVHTKRFAYENLYHTSYIHKGVHRNVLLGGFQEVYDSERIYYMHHN